MIQNRKLGSGSIIFIYSLPLITLVKFSTFFSLQFESFSASPGCQILSKGNRKGSISKGRGERAPIKLKRWRPLLSGCESPPTQGGGRHHVTLPRLAPPPAAVPDGRQRSERGRRRPFCACFLRDAVVAVGSGQ